MKVTFLGVGEACDERHPNTSILLEVEDNDGETRTVLLDCGFAVPFQFWKYVADPDKLDVLWISHFHGDHFLGTPLLLLRFWEMKRKKPLIIVSPRGGGSNIEKALELAYPGFMSRFAFELVFKEVDEGEEVSIASFKWMFASTEHGQKNLSIAIDTNDGKIFYSGDGKPTVATEEIAKNSSLLIHEAFHIEPSVPGHGTVQGVMEMAERVGATSVACVHVQRDVRRAHQDKIRKLLAERPFIKAFLPLSGDVVKVGKS
ncbi:MAG: ribonuclease Z [Syntrophobacterales bacterium]|nr:ribonuclease Z [Syntrophobacterales bacterium]